MEETKSVLQERLDNTVQLALKNPKGAIEEYKAIIRLDPSTLTDEIDPSKIQEQAIYRLGELYVEQKNRDELTSLFTEVRPFFATIPKARTAKIVRTLLDLIAKIPDSSELQVELCKNCIQWCQAEKRTFLRHRVETRLALLYLQQQRYQLGLKVVSELSKEVKKLDDKLLLVEIFLIESKLYFAIRNLHKSKAALTACRTNANAIHCPPLLQADIDMQAGVLHAEEKDPETAYSYFYEAFEAYNVSENPKAVQALKYMMLAKILCNQPGEVNTISSGRHGVKYSGTDVDALKAVAKCHKQRSLHAFNETLDKYDSHLRGDPIIEGHIKDLCETLLEQNILRILEPYSRVEIDHIAKLIDLPLDTIQSKLSEMILDKKLHGTLDQGVGVAILFDAPDVSELYENVLATFRNMSKVVEVLHEKAQMV